MGSRAQLAGDSALSRAVTLLELLAVIAVVSILALIAVTNLDLARANAKVARVRADMRILADALQCYRLDHRQYPPAADRDELLDHPLNCLTTPVAYITAVPEDPFGPAPLAPLPTVFMVGYDYKDRATTSIGMPAETFGHVWEEASQFDYFVHSCGPNCLWDVYPYVEYDPSNGAISLGDITRFGP